MAVGQAGKGRGVRRGGMTGWRAGRWELVRKDCLVEEVGRVAASTFSSSRGVRRRGRRRGGGGLLCGRRRWRCGGEGGGWGMRWVGGWGLSN